MDIINALGELAVKAGWLGVQTFFYGIAATLAIGGVVLFFLCVYALLNWIFGR